MKNAEPALPQDASVHFQLVADHQQKGDKGNAVIALENSPSITANQGGFFRDPAGKAPLKQLQSKGLVP